MSSPSSAPSAPVDGFGDTLGPEAPQRMAILIMAPRANGSNLSLVLFGVVLANYLEYYRSPSYLKEDRSTRIVVLVVFLLLAWTEAAAWVTVTRAAYDQDRTVPGLAVFKAEQVIGALVAFLPPTIVQAFLARRTCLFTDDRRTRRVLSVGLAVLISAALACGLGIFAGVCFLYNGRPAPYTADLLTAYYAIAAVIDVAVSGILASLLFRRAAGFNKTTDGILKKVARTSLLTASYTALFAVVAAVLVPTLQHTPYHVVAGVFTDQFNALYTLSLFTTVSLRQELMRQKAMDPLGGGRDLSSYGTRAEARRPSAVDGKAGLRPVLPAVRARKDTATTTDSSPWSDLHAEERNAKWLAHEREIKSAATV